MGKASKVLQLGPPCPGGSPNHLATLLLGGKEDSQGLVCRVS